MSPEPVARTNVDRVPTIDLVRLVSLLLVLAVHLATANIARFPRPGIGQDLWLIASRNGSYGVTLFFVVSGLVITRTILRREPRPGDIDIRAFYARRAARILPLLLFACALGAAAMTLGASGPARDYCLREPAARFDWGFWLSLPTLSFNWLRIVREADSFGFGLHWDILWSLAIEEQFYLLYPLLLRWSGTRERLARALFVFVALGPLSRAAAASVRPDSFLLGFTGSFGAFEQMALGALLCLALERRTESLRKVGASLEWLLGLGGAVGVSAVYLLTDLNRPFDRTIGPTLIAVSVSAFLFAGVRRGWFRSAAGSHLSRTALLRGLPPAPHRAVHVVALAPASACGRRSRDVWRRHDRGGLGQLSLVRDPSQRCPPAPDEHRLRGAPAGTSLRGLSGGPRWLGRRPPVSTTIFWKTRPPSTAQSLST